MTSTNFLLLLFLLIVVTCINGEDDFQQFATLKEFNEYKQQNLPKESVPLYRVWLTEAYNEVGAKCLDGTQPALYFRPGYGDGINKFQINLQGGAWCAGVGDVVSGMMNTCYQRSHGTLGSSKNWLQYMSPCCYMSDDKNINPLTYNWNIAFIKYCDGGSFSGDNETVTYYNNNTLYFRGFRILKGALDLLKRDYGLNSSITQVLLSGGSAGGLSTFLHTQYIYDNYIVPLNNKIHFMSMPDAGFFLQYQGPNDFQTGMKWIYYYQNATSAMNEKCVEYYGDEEAWKCIFAQNTAPFISLPLPGMFALQSRYDSYQIKEELGLEQNTTNINAIDVYGANMTVTFINNYINSSNKSAFFDACSYHSAKSWTDVNITINDTATPNAAMQWFYNTDGIWYWKPKNNYFWFGNETYPCYTCGCPSNLTQNKDFFG